MADPFSTAAGVISVISLVYQITQTMVRFGFDWREAPDDVKSFLAQLQALKTVLAETRANITLSTEFADAFQDQNRESSLLSQLGDAAPDTTDTKVLLLECQQKLQDLLKDLNKRGSRLQAGRDIPIWERFKAAFMAKNLRSSVENLHRQCQILNNLVMIDTAVLAAATYNEVKETRAENQIWQRSERSRRILSWLAETDYGARLSDYLSQRQEGTGGWILNKDELKRWMESDGKCTLFCPGLPGAGKTVMASIIIDELYRQFHKDDNIGITFYFCDFHSSDERKAEHMLASLLKQLLHKDASLPPAVEDLYFTYESKGTRPSAKELASALGSVFGRYSRVFIVVDALDEWQTPNDPLDPILKTIFRLQDQYNVNLLATSRFIPEITVQFEKCLSFEIHASDSDVEEYLREHMSQLPTFVRANATLQGEIIGGITKAVDGIFLLAHLHLNSLIGKVSPKAIRTALKKLPSGSDAYDAAYQGIMKRVENQLPDQVKLAKRVLSWIVCARRPLKQTELLHALAVEPQEHEFDKSNLSDVSTIISPCAGLVTVDEKSSIIRLIHYTTQEYLDRTQAYWFPMAHVDIATTCLAYLSFDVFASRKHERSEGYETLLEYCFYNYSARNWGHHARDHSVKESLIMEFLRDDSKVSASAKQLGIPLDVVTLDESSLPPASSASSVLKGVFLAAHFGLDSLLKTVLDNNSSYSRLRDSKGRTPLCYAAGSGHRSVVELLLEKGAELNHFDKKGYSPLLRAAAMGHTETAKLMLEKGADPNTKTELNYTPLLLAAKEGHASMLEALLEKNADPNLKNRCGETSLSTAVLGNRREIVKILLGHGAFPNSKGLCGQTALYHAIGKGDEAMVKLLLEHGADPNQNDNFGQTCFYRAAALNNVAMANLLMQNGADPQLAAGGGTTLLFTAANKGHNGIVKLLLTSGVEPDTKDTNGRTPLSMAVASGHEEVIKLLLEKGADPKVGDKMGQTPLSLSAKGGHDAVFKLFLECGVEIETIDVKGRTPLSEAARSGFKEGVKMLLGKGANPNHKDKKRRTPLVHAVKGKHDSQELMRMLLQKGADPNLMDKKRQTPLSIAAGNGLKSVVELLLGEGANLEPVDREGMTPLSKAAKKMDNDEILKILLDKGSDPNHRDNNGQTPLSQAVSTDYRYNKGAMKLLLEKGANPNLKDTWGRPILVQAIGSTFDDESTFYDEASSQRIELLLENGAQPDVNYKDVDGMTALSHATEHGLEQVITLLLQNGADVNSCDNDGRTPLSKAAETLDTDIEDAIGLVNLLLANGATLDTRDNNGRNPLSWAAIGGGYWEDKIGEYGSYEMVRLFLDQGLDIESRDDNGRTSLSWAVQAQSNRDSIVKLLLERGADPDSRDNSGRSPLSWALTTGDNEKVVDILLERGADPDSRDNSGRSPLSWALTTRGNEKVVNILLERGAEADSQDSQGRSPLLYAAWCYPEMVSKLLAKGADPDSKDVNGRGPISYAAGYHVYSSMEAVDAVKMLAERGADRDFNDNSGRSPLSYAAAQSGSNDIVTILLEKGGVDLDFADNTGRTPLSWAASTGGSSGNDIKMTKLLLDKGANPNLKDNDGRTPLSWSAEHHRAANLVALLLERGADLHSKDKNGRTPLSWAAEHGAGNVVALLLKKGAEFDCKDANGRTSLSWAAVAKFSMDRHYAVTLLLEKGANPDLKDNSGRSPLYWAASCGHRGAAEILLKKGADTYCQDNKGSTPLSKAVEKGWERVVRLLSNVPEDPDEVYDHDPDDDIQVIFPQVIATSMSTDPAWMHNHQAELLTQMTQMEFQMELKAHEV
ncbi:hypothetical protein FQN52_003093 [Onygenales sp. PD_12]|nr:hypothetical protein FQN52_003093 [Onygenales sp. PD_12]